MHILNSLNNKEKFLTFSSRLPKGIFDSPKKIPRLRCALCGCRMLSPEEKLRIYRPLHFSPNNYSLPLRNIMHNIEKIKSDLPKGHEDLFDILLDYHKQFPLKNLNRIINDNRIYMYQSYLLHNQQIIHKSKLNKRINNIRELLKNQPLENRLKFETLKAQVIEVTKQKERSDIMRRVLIKEIFTPLLETLTSKTLKIKIEREIKKIDLEKITKEYLFCKLHNNKDLNQEKVIEFLIDPLSNTFEHVTPESFGGKKEKNNGIFMCAKCNLDRQTTPYKILMKAYPDFLKNIQKQVSRLSTFIVRGKLIGYNNYPIEMQQKIKEATDMDINITSFLRNQRKLNRET